MGIRHAFGQRNAPTILNALFNTLQFWDGRAPTLEAQIEGPIVNPVKMGNTWTLRCAGARRRQTPYLLSSRSRIVPNRKATIFSAEQSSTSKTDAISGHLLERSKLSWHRGFVSFIHRL